MRLSKRVEYALISLLHIDSQSGDSIVSCKEISDKYNIPYEILAKVLQQLVKGKMIESIQGVKGGYKLLIKIDDVSIGKIIEIIEGPIKLTDCLNHDKGCNRIEFCNINSIINRFNNRIRQSANEMMIK